MIAVATPIQLVQLGGSVSARHIFANNTSVQTVQYSSLFSFFVLILALSNLALTESLALLHVSTHVILN